MLPLRPYFLGTENSSDSTLQQERNSFRSRKGRRENAAQLISNERIQREKRKEKVPVGYGYIALQKKEGNKELPTTWVLTRIKFLTKERITASKR